MAITPMLVRMQLTDFSWSPAYTPDGMSPADASLSPNARAIYLWTAFFKVDGSNVSVGPNLQLQQLQGQ